MLLSAMIIAKMTMTVSVLSAGRTAPKIPQPVVPYVCLKVRHALKKSLMMLSS